QREDFQHDRRRNAHNLHADHHHCESPQCPTRVRCPCIISIDRVQPRIVHLCEDPQHQKICWSRRQNGDHNGDCHGGFPPPVRMPEPCHGSTEQSATDIRRDILHTEEQQCAQSRQKHQQCQEHAHQRAARKCVAVHVHQEQGGGGG